MLIDGKEIAQHILENLKPRVVKLQNLYGITPHLAVIRVGDDSTITSYVNQKEKTAKKIGVKVTVFHYPETISQEIIEEKLTALDNNQQIHGIIIQLPLPKSLDEQKLLLIVSPKKDVDGFHPLSRFYVPLASAVIAVLQEIHFNKDPLEEVSFFHWLQACTIAVIGKGRTGGEPIITLFRKMRLNPTVIDSKTNNKDSLMQQADILITAVGKSHIVTGKNCKKDGILIGIGMGKNTDGTFFGDYDTAEIQDIAAFYTPIPGGVGPVNVAKLMENVVIAAENSLQKN